MVVESVPALVVGIVAAVYWSRVLRLVIKIRRKHGRSANLLPREKLGLALRAVWVPAVCGWVAVPLAMALCHHKPQSLEPLYNSLPLKTAAALLAIACLVLTWICWRRMGKSWRMGINPAEKTQLVVTGPYAYLRHPIYALSTLLMLSTMAAAPSPLMLLCGIIHLLFLQWEARREERYLVSVHGNVYAAYMAAVGRFCPRSLHPHIPESH